MTSRPIKLLILFSLLIASHSAFPKLDDDYQPIYVTYFHTENQYLKRFLVDITKTFESKLISNGCCKTVSRKEINRLIAERENESLIIPTEKNLALIGAKSFISGEILDQPTAGQVKLIISLTSFDGVKIFSAIERVDTQLIHTAERDKVIERLAMRLSDSIKLKSTKQPPVNTHQFSAKAIADKEYGKGKYVPQYWWSLVCRSIDVIYDSEISKLYPNQVGKPAVTPKQKEIWMNILDTTINDIRSDQIRIKGKRAMSRKTIKNKILKANDCKSR